MKYLLLAALIVGLILPWSASSAQNIVGKEGGIVSIPSNHSVDETVDRLKNILRSKEITLFAIINHSGEAAKVGMEMPPTKLLILLFRHPGPIDLGSIAGRGRASQQKRFKSFLR